MTNMRDFMKRYRCHECGDRLASYEVFESGWPNHIRHWCFRHIPLRSQARLCWQESALRRWVPWLSK